MRIGIRLPQYGGTWDDIRVAAVRAERLGFDGVWLNDHLQSPGRLKTEPTFEALTTLGAVAALTTHVRLGVVVLSASYRSAPLTVKMTSTLAAIAGPGRVVVGLGTGSDVAEHRAFAVAFATPGERTERLRATLAVFRRMGAQPDGATIAGGIDRAPNHPHARPPIWIAAHHPRLLRLAGREADGIVAAFVAPEVLRTRLEVARAARAADAGPLAACLYTFAVPVVAETRAWLRPEATALGTTPERLFRWLATTGIVAPPDELAERLAEHAAAGATDAVLALPSRTPPEMIDAVAEAAGITR